MKAFLRALLTRLLRWLSRPSDSSRLIEAQAQNRALLTVINALPQRERDNFGLFSEMAGELIEARMMAGAGPGSSNPSPRLIEEAHKTILRIQERALGVRETLPLSGAAGSYGDIELALQNIEWRREITMSWLEFSRWGIQQIILISRLYYIKNPLLRRAIDVCAVYVFGRGVEVTSTDKKANDVLKDCFDRNRKVLGPHALMKLQRRKYYDGNLYFAAFADVENAGVVDWRTIDATEIQEIVTDPADGDKEIFFKRMWEEEEFDLSTGAKTPVRKIAWYPALSLDDKPPLVPETIGADPVIKGVYVYHRKCGEVGKWKIGVPRAFPALDWAKVTRQYLEACLTLAKSHAQIAWQFATKGGQGAVEGIKQQLQTNVNSAPGNTLWDQNPTPVNASIVGMGTGTELSMVAARGKGLDPAEVKEYRNMVGMCFGIPPTWLGDMETANLSTATTLDRPTELGFRAEQIEWEEDLTIIARYTLKVSAGATDGKLREALGNGKVVYIRPAPKKIGKGGALVYDEAAKPSDDEIQVRVTFPAIREGDLPAIINAIVAAATLDNKGGQVVGIDEKVTVRLLLEALGVEDAEDVLAEMYPEKTTGKEGDPNYEPAYDPSRTKVPLPPPIGKALPPAGGLPQNPGGLQPLNTAPGTPTPGQPGPQDKPLPTSTEAARRLFEALRRYKEKRAS
jgi:hypothetical protein